MRTLVAWPDSQALAGGLAAALGCETLALETRRFPDEELYLCVTGDARDRHAVVVASLDRPDLKFPGLLFLADLLRHEGALSVGLAAPYLAYLRQDTQFQPGEAVTSRTFARMISGSFDWLITVDPHLHRYQSLGEIYSIPNRVLHAAPAVADWIGCNAPAPVLIGPDSESAQWVSDIASRIGAPWLTLEKKRHGDRSVEVSIPNPARLTGRTPVLVDDILSSGRTMIAAARRLVALGHHEITCIGVHAILAGDARAAMHDAGIHRIVTCNTIADPTNQIDLTADLAAAVNAMPPNRA